MTAGKVVHVSTVHRGDDVRIFVKECRSLVESGYDVTLIARGSEQAVLSGVKVVPLGQIGGGRLGRATRGVIRATRLAVKERPDIIHLHDPELIPAGIVLRLLGKRVIYDAHESLAKQVRSKSWIPFGLNHIVSALARLLTLLAGSIMSAVVVATPAIARDFGRGRIAIVRNFPRLDELGDIDTTDYADRKPVAAYIGGITWERGALEMAVATHLLAGEVNAILAGPIGDPDLERQMVEFGGDDLELLGRIGRDQVVSLLQRARIGLLLLRPEPNYIESYPVKLFEYMAAGIPVIASDFPFWRQFIIDHDAGVMVDPSDPRAIAEAIRLLMADPERAQQMGVNGRVAVERHYSWDQEAETLASLYREVITT